MDLALPEDRRVADRRTSHPPASCATFNANSRSFRRQLSALVIAFFAAVIGFMWRIQVAADQVRDQGVQIHALINTTEQTCLDRRDARDAIRLLFLNDPATTNADLELIDKFLPPLQCEAIAP